MRTATPTRLAMSRNRGGSANALANNTSFWEISGRVSDRIRLSWRWLGWSLRSPIRFNIEIPVVFCSFKSAFELQFKIQYFVSVICWNYFATRENCLLNKDQCSSFKNTKKSNCKLSLDGINQAEVHCNNVTSEALPAIFCVGHCSWIMELLLERNTCVGGRIIQYGGQNFVIGCNLANGLKNSQSSILIVALIREFRLDKTSISFAFLLLLFLPLLYLDFSGDNDGL